MPDLPDPESGGYETAKRALDGAVSLAGDVLWALSGRQFGVCAVSVRPCPVSPHPGGYGGPVTSYVLSWEGYGWVNVPCACVGRCERSGPRAVHLPGPVRAVDRVVVAGVEVDPSGYILEDNVLYRVGQPWPSQNLGVPLGEPGTWSVDYQRGQPVPDGVDRLTGILAREFHASCSGDKCRLPRTVTNVSRQGVTYQVHNPQDIYNNGKTGLPEIDTWLAAVNPQALQQPPAVL